jgi:ClpP class serine protease
MKNTQKEINSEVSQGPSSRTRLFAPIERGLDGRVLVSLFTSFNYNVQLDDDDCDMLQSVLQANDLSNGLVLMLSTPGGDGLAAERIVNTLRAHSGTGDYWVIVPGKAKSAGTIVAMGAAKIYMAPSSELGPVDPQIIRTEDGRRRVFSAHALVSGYDRLFGMATQATGPIEPYLQQLANYDDREINSYRSAIDLSEDIAKKLLASGMLAGTNIGAIAQQIEIFLNPRAGTLAHGRPIYASEAAGCGLVIENVDVQSDFWRKIYELYARTERFVSYQACKSIESRKDSFYVQCPE